MKLIADSGSTKTDWALVAGEEPAHVCHTQGINPFHQDEATIASILHNELLPQLPAGDVHEVCFYGSGVRPELQPLMQRLLQACFPQALRVEAYGDLLGAARALCGRGEGIACILGTGANSCLFDGTDIVMNTPPLGYILGDEGSGAVLGIRLLNGLFKGSLPAELCEAFLAEQGLTMVDVIARVYRQPMPNRFLASLSPFVARHLDVSQMRAMVVDHFRCFLSRNVRQYGRPDLPVSFVGSIAHHYQSLLREAVLAEGMAMGTVLKSPLEGLVGYHR